MSKGSVRNALSSIKSSVEKLTSLAGRLGRRVRDLEEDAEILFESQDMNVWVLVKGVLDGSIAPGESPEDALRAISRLQENYKTAVAVASFLRELNNSDVE